MTVIRIFPVICIICIFALILPVISETQSEKAMPHDKKKEGTSPISAKKESASNKSSISPGISLPNYQSPVPLLPLLTRPTDHSVNVNILPTENVGIYIEYRRDNETAFNKTPSTIGKAGVPINIELSQLIPDTAYQYHIGVTRPGNATVLYSPDYSFHTRRDPETPFVFDIQADSHLDERTIESLYSQTLNNMLLDKPDFLIDLGDTFMTDKLSSQNNETILQQYIRQRIYLDEIGHSVPIFLVLGNHDGEAGYNLNSQNKDLAQYSVQDRKTYFPNPVPGEFYTGNPDNESSTGPKEDYYAWEWGDALFVVLDPYGYTQTKPGGNIDGWGWTLGFDQYQWLKETLEKSKSQYKFVFAHHLVGGDIQGRGGTEYASLYEWGGYNQNGTWGFDEQRPGWDVPIHQLLVDTNVTAFFHGHDHIFARQELDGVIYQAVPQPATIGSSKNSPGAEYGYVNGDMQKSPGHLRVVVSPESVNVAYIRSCLSDDGKCDVKNGEVVYSYVIPP